MPISKYLRDLRAKVGTTPLMMPAITALIFDQHDRVLLHRARDDGRWHTIGGAVDPNEEPADSVVREVLEETGLLVEPIRVVGVYADPPVRYANGDVVLYTSIAFECRIVGGHLHLADDESLELAYFALDQLPELSSLDRAKIQVALKRHPQADFRCNTSATGMSRKGNGSDSA
jgi:8-oxo-dGTP pyrophosphatase MutT (NUDIX family)